MAGTAALPCSPLSVDISRALALANVVLLGAGQDNSGGEEEQGGHRSLEQSSAKLAPWHATIIISLATGDNSLNFRSRALRTCGHNNRCYSAASNVEIFCPLRKSVIGFQLKFKVGLSTPKVAIFCKVVSWLCESCLLTLVERRRHVFWVYKQVNLGNSEVNIFILFFNFQES